MALLEPPVNAGQSPDLPAAAGGPTVAGAAPTPTAAPPDRDRVIVVPRPSQLHAHEELPDPRPVLLASTGPAAARREADHARRQARLRATLRRIGLLLIIVVAPLAVGAVLALLLSSIR